MKLLAKIAIGLWLLVFGYFLYGGITTLPVEGDSLAYHIPIAENVAEGKIWEFYGLGNPYRLYFYPAMGETVLAVFIKTGLPLNSFNVLGWAVLSGCIYGLTRRIGLNRSEAIVSSVAMVVWPSVIRLIPNQTVDIWLAVWFTASLWMWEKAVKTRMDWLSLGLFMGMLAGTKYSGPMFVIILLAVYIRQWWKKTVETGIVFAVLLIVGGWWYLRNMMVTGNPIYPGWLWIWKGDPTFRLQDWTPWKTIFLYNGGWLSWLSAMVSEYLIWPAVLVLPFIYRHRLVLLGTLCFLGYLIMPSWPQNVVSDLRYLFPAFIALSAAAWKLAKDKSISGEIAVLALLTSMIELTQLDFKPKLFVVVLVIYIVAYKVRKYFNY